MHDPVTLSKKSMQVETGMVSVVLGIKNAFCRTTYSNTWPQLGGPFEEMMGPLGCHRVSVALINTMVVSNLRRREFILLILLCLSPL